MRPYWLCAITEEVINKYTTTKQQKVISACNWVARSARNNLHERKGDNTPTMIPFIKCHLVDITIKILN